MIRAINLQLKKQRFDSYERKQVFDENSREGVSLTKA